MNAVQTIYLQVALEYQLDQNSLLVPIPGSEEQSWVVVYRHAAGYLPFFRYDLPSEARRRLLALGAAEIYHQPSEVENLLRKYVPCRSAGLFRTCCFTHHPAPAEYPAVARNEDCFSVYINGVEVSRAWSVRQNDRCAELAVETLPDYRGRGYARQVSAAWGGAVLRQGRVAFYSHRIENRASAALARSLGVTWLADCTGFE
ncbi:MAG: GNAT family N-acetyltransferase [Anaerolineales bacterium]|nr:GNAT family N-acetyltransferase [Anaerolineales bacterium]